MEIILEERVSGRHVFKSPIDEPVLYRLIRGMINEGIDIRRKAEQEIEKTAPAALEDLWKSINGI